MSLGGRGGRTSSLAVLLLALAVAAPAHAQTDTTPPEPFALESPADGATVYTRTPVLSWQTPADTGSGVAYQYVFIDGHAEEQLGPEENSVMAPGLAPGSHTWMIRAVDAGGNSRDSETRTLTVVDDLTPPAPFALLVPAAGAVVGDRTPTFSWEPASDTASGVDSYAVRVDGILVAETAAMQTSAIPGQQLADGPHDWLVQASDAAGNVRTSDKHAFTVDASPPVASIVPEAATMRAGEYVDFDARGSRDAVTAIARYEWDLDGDGGFDTNTGAQPTVAQRYDTPGERTVAVRVTDRAGNTDATAAKIEITGGGGVGTPPPPGTGSVEILHGARYTRRRSVTIALRWPAGATAMLVSQDPGFAGAVQQPLASRLTWRLTGSGADRRPEVVYVRFLGGPAALSADSILLDRTRPRVRRAIVDRSARRMRLRVKDSVSGVASLQLTTDRSRPAKRIRYRRSLRVRRGAVPRWVRAYDRAGNRSKWRRIGSRR